MEKYLLPKIVDQGGDISQRWYVEYKFMHPETNKFVKFREWISSKLTTRTARYAKATEIKNTISIKLKSGYNPFESKQQSYTISEAFQEALIIKKATTGKRSVGTYTSLSNSFLKWLALKKYDKLRPRELNKYHAQEFLDYILTVKKLSARTHNNYLVCMRTLFECFFTRDYIDLNVWKKIPKLRTKESSFSFFNTNDRKEITEYLIEDHYPLYCCSLLIFYCFLRPAEIVRLRISDIDFTKNQIIVKGSQSKNGKTQIVVMHPNLVDSLKKLGLENYPGDYFIFATTKRLLPSPKEIAPTRIADAWRWNVKDKYGVTQNIYDFKHTGVGEALESGIHTRDIQLQIRHASLDETQNYLNKISNKAGQVFRDKMPSF